MNNTITIGLPVSPATFIERSTKNVTEILISHGGGMGGASYRKYGTIITRNDNGFLIFETFLGERIEINQRWVVSIEDKQLIEIIVDVTEHSNYHKHTCEKHITTECCIVDLSDEVVFNDSFDHDDRNIIYSHKEITK